MYYVLGYQPSAKTLIYFFATEDSEDAMASRFALERVSGEEGFRGTEVVSVDAPDLWEVRQRYSQYFTGAGRERLIKDCFFCRAYLGQGEPNMRKVDHLAQQAKTHGHCLFCHDIYPVVGDDGEAYIALALKYHARTCTARDHTNPP